MLLRPKKEARGPLGAFFRWFNRVFGKATESYVGACHHLIRKAGLSFLLLGLMVVAAGFFGKKIPGSFLPDEDQGYLYAGLQLPEAALCNARRRLLAKWKKPSWRRPESHMLAPSWATAC